MADSLPCHPLDRVAFRAQLRGETPREMQEMICMLLESAGELARELKYSAPQFARMAIEVWCAARDKRVTFFEDFEEDPQRDNGPKLETEIVVGIAANWIEQ